MNPGAKPPYTYIVMSPSADHSRRTSSASASKGRPRRKRGRPRSRAWSKRSEFLRRHSPKYLRRNQVTRLIAADNFATRIGHPLKTFVSIRWIYTADGEANINRRFSALLNAIRIWCSRHGIEWHAIAVHENPEKSTPAFNTHILASIPVHLHGELNDWLQKRLGGSPEAIDVRKRLSVNWNSDGTLRYILKGSDPQTARGLGIRYKNQGIIEFRRCTMTRNLNANAIEAWKNAGIDRVDRYPVSEKKSKLPKNKNAA